jgi:hypothetical protein
VIRALFRLKPKHFEHGARVRTKRNCLAGFFAKGQHGTVIESDACGMYRVRFDNRTTHWVDAIEVKRIPRRGSMFANFGIAWAWFWRRPV